MNGMIKLLHLGEERGLKKARVNIKKNNNKTKYSECFVTS